MKTSIDFRQYDRLIVVVLVGLGAGFFALIYQHTHKPLGNICSTGNEAACGYAGSTKPDTTKSPAPEASSTTIPATGSSSIKQTPSSAAPTNSRETDNSAKCSSMATTGNANLESLQSQITEQLQIMKAIIGNSSLDNEILSYGGNLSQIIGQSEITESFNQADANATSLINQYSSAKSSLIDQLIGLNNGTSPGCTAALKPLVGM